jgi:hypothetical protein
VSFPDEFADSSYEVLLSHFPGELEQQLPEKFEPAFLFSRGGTDAMFRACALNFFWSGDISSESDAPTRTTAVLSACDSIGMSSKRLC